MVNYRVETNHPWPDNTVWGGFFLVISNFVLLYPFFRFIYYGRVDVAGVLGALMFKSCLYHACRAGFVCTMPFRIAQEHDHLGVYAALVWISVCCIVRESWWYRGAVAPVMSREITALVWKTRVGIYFVLQAVCEGFVINNPESLWTNVFGFGIPIALVILSATVTRTPIFERPWYGWSGVALFGVAVVFYKMCPSSWYDWAHTTWHILSMFAIPLVTIGCDKNFGKVVMN